MQFISDDLVERAGAEIFMLNSCHKAAEEAQGVMAPLRLKINDDEEKAQIIIGIQDTFGAGYASDIVYKLIPLQFVASIKVLDMIVEWIFDCNQISYSFQASNKISIGRSKSINLPTTLPSDIWERLFELYAQLTPYRNAIAHGGWGKSNRQGINFDCEIYNSEQKKKHHIQEIFSIEELTALRDTVRYSYHLCLGINNPYLIKQLKYSLDKLKKYHKQNLYKERQTEIVYVCREVKPDAKILEDFQVRLEPIKRRIQEISANGARIVENIEITYGDPLNPLLRYLIPYEKIKDIEIIQLGRNTGQWDEYKI